MARPVTLFTGQWADLPLEVLAQKAKDFGYDGLELACWGDHFDVTQGQKKEYCDDRRAILARHGLKCWALSAHLVGQAVCDNIDERHKAILPPHVWGDGKPEGVRKRAAEELMKTARAAQNMGVKVICGFTGSKIWHLLYSFPPVSPAMIDDGFEDFARRWNPILDEFKKAGVRFALEVHPTEIAYDIITFERALNAVNGHPAFGINFDPSHLVHQFIDPTELIYAFPDRIFHAHVKDAKVSLTGRNSILSSHLSFGDRRRGWDFVSPGRGDVKWDPIVRALNRIGYQGPLSIEWEDSGMDREFGAPESLALMRRMDFTPSAVAFDAAFAK